MLTKSGIIVGLGETNDEVVETMRDLRANGVDVVTIGQYLQPSAKHATIDRWVHPDEFRWFREQGEALGFGSVFSGPLVRSATAPTSSATRPRPAAAPSPTETPTPVRVLRLCWLGIPAREYEPMVRLLRDVMGLAVEFEEPTTTELSLPSGDRVQVFAPGIPTSSSSASR